MVVCYVPCFSPAPQLGREVLEEALKAASVGVTTEEIDQLVHEVNAFI